MHLIQAQLLISDTFRLYYPVMTIFKEPSFKMVCCNDPNNQINKMKSALLLVVFVAVFTSEIATNTVLRSNQIILQPEKRNTLNFPGGQVDGSGKPTVVSGRSNYRQSGQPSQLQANGSSLVSNVPAGVPGQMIARISYPAILGCDRFRPNQANNTIKRISLELASNQAEYQKIQADISKATQRMDQFQLEINKLTNASDSVHSQITQVKANIKALNSQIQITQAQFNRTNSQISSMQISITQIKYKIQDLSVKAPQKERQSNPIKGKVVSGNDAQETFARAKEALEKINIQALSAKTALKNADDRVARARAELAAAETEQLQARNAASTFERKIQQAQSAYENAQNRVKRGNSDVQQTSSQFVDSSTQIKQLYAYLEAIYSLKSQAEVKAKISQTKISQLNSQLNQIKKKLEDLEAFANSYQARLAGFRAQIGWLQYQIASYRITLEKLNDTIKDQQTKLKQAQADYSKAMSDFKKCQEQTAAEQAKQKLNGYLPPIIPIDCKNITNLTPGSGILTGLGGPQFIFVNNDRQIFVDGCSKMQCNASRKGFKLSDEVSFQVENIGGRQFVRTMACI